MGGPFDPELLASEHSLSQRCNRIARQASDLEADKTALEAYVRDLERDPSGRSTAPIVHFMNEAKKAAARAEAAEQVLLAVARAVRQPNGAWTIVNAVHELVAQWQATRGGG